MWITEKEIRIKWKDGKNIFEVIIAPNLPNMMNNINPHIWEAQQIPGMKNAKGSIHRYILVKLWKTKKMINSWKHQEEKRLIQYRKQHSD